MNFKFKILYVILALFLFSCEISGGETKKQVNRYTGTESIEQVSVSAGETNTPEAESPGHPTAPTPPEEDDAYIPVYEINPKFAELLKINADVVGSVRVPGTLINFPVVYSGDNEYYLRRDIYGADTKYGTVFMDGFNHGSILDKNTVIHGHNFNEPHRGIYDDNMFADLEKFKDREFFDANKTVIFDNLYSNMEWEVFSVYVTPEEDYYIYTRFSSDRDFTNFAEYVKSRSMFESDYLPKAGDYMLTLHTCSYEFAGAHTLVHARLVKKTDNLRK